MSLPLRSKNPATLFSEESPKPELTWYWSSLSSLIDEEPPTGIVGSTKTGRVLEGINISALSCIDHEAYAVVPCDSTVVIGAGRAVAIVSLLIDEEADTEVGGSAMPVARALMLVVAIEVQFHADRTSPVMPGGMAEADSGIVQVAAAW